MRIGFALTVLLAATLEAQPASAPRFEVVSIRPTDPGDYESGSGIQTGKGRLIGQHVTLKRCIMGAYAIGPNQIFGGPSWLDTDRFEIQAKSDRSTDDGKLFDEMLRTVLAERFQLVFHRETRSTQAYVVSVAKSGPKLAKTTAGEAATDSGRGRLHARAVTMRRFAEILARQMDLPVVDKTGIDGAFDLKLDWNPDSRRPEAGPSLFTAMQEQLGLRLTSRKEPVEMFVIDRAVKPAEN